MLTQFCKWAFSRLALAVARCRGEMLSLRMQVGLLCCATLVGANLFTSQPALAVSYDEAMVRAAVVFGILRFTRWPESQRPEDVIELCSIGQSASAKSIADLESPPPIGSKNIRYRSIDNSMELDKCHAVIVGESAALLDEPLEPMNVANGIPQLVICDGCGSKIESVAAVKLMRVDERVQFAVNLDPIHSQNMSLSSSLIELAVACRSTLRSIRICND